MLNAYPESARAIWVDLFNPTDAEKEEVRTKYGITVPSRDNLDEIESSSRLRNDGTALYLSMPVGVHSIADDAAPAPVGFVLTPKLLVTVRYSELRSFASALGRVAKADPPFGSAETFAAVIEEMVDVSADLLEKIGSQLFDISKRVFHRSDSRVKETNRMLREMLVSVGGAGEKLSHIRESILGLQRIIGFAGDTASDWLPATLQPRFKTVRNDLLSLADFEVHLSGKVQFLLDAILGFINTEQNDIFKVLTIVSVVGIPPTFIASMYGMNFHNMPEYNWAWGYQWGLGLIVVSTLAPVIWFKIRGWW